MLLIYCGATGDKKMAVLKMMDFHPGDLSSVSRETYTSHCCNQE